MRRKGELLWVLLKIVMIDILVLRSLVIKGTGNCSNMETCSSFLRSLSNAPVISVGSATHVVIVFLRRTEYRGCNGNIRINGEPNHAAEIKLRSNS